MPDSRLVLAKAILRSYFTLAGGVDHAGMQGVRIMKEEAQKHADMAAAHRIVAVVLGKCSTQNEASEFLESYVAEPQGPDRHVNWGQLSKTRTMSKLLTTYCMTAVRECNEIETEGWCQCGLYIRALFEEVLGKAKT